MGNSVKAHETTAWTEKELVELAGELGLTANENGSRLNGQEPITVRQAGGLALLCGKRLEDILPV